MSAAPAEAFRYLERGDGPRTVVFLHGLFGRPENWAAVMDALFDSDASGGRHSDRWRCLAPQLPIDHRASVSSRPFRSIHQLTEFVRAFLDAVGVERAVLCGNSLGGQVAIDFTLQHSERVEKLVLTGSAGLLERSLSGGERPKATRAFIREKAREVFYDPDPIVTDELVEELHRMLSDRAYARFLLRVAKASRDYNVKAHLPKLSVPVLLVWGRDDRITPPDVAHEFYERLRDAQLVFLERCGHAPPLERPRAFAEALRAFLSSGGRPRPNRPKSKTGAGLG